MKENQGPRFQGQRRNSLIVWDPEPKKEIRVPKFLEKKGLRVIGMIDHFAGILPTLSKRFSKHASIPGCELPADHECWQIWPQKHNNLPNTFATHSELYGFAQMGSQMQEMQEKHEKALRGPLNGKSVGLDGREYEQKGMPSYPTIRHLGH
eukprot:6171374-Amphidinium_carterae.5